jgi:hypothetical protein
VDFLQSGEKMAFHCDLDAKFFLVPQEWVDKAIGTRLLEAAIRVLPTKAEIQLLSQPQNQESFSDDGTLFTALIDFLTQVQTVQRLVYTERKELKKEKTMLEKSYSEHKKVIKE